MNTLPYDYDRCTGTDRPECQDCRRREPGRVEYQWMMTPPDFEEKCPLKIEGVSDEMDRI